MAIKWLQERGTGSKYEVGITLEGPCVASAIYDHPGTSKQNWKQGRLRFACVSISYRIFWYSPQQVQNATVLARALPCPGQSTVVTLLGEYSQVGILGLRYKFVNFGVKNSLGSPDW